MTELLQLREEGLYCAEGDFYVDPWQPVERAVVTHGHGDHAVAGSRTVHATKAGEAILARRLRSDEPFEQITHAYGKPFELGDVKVSLHSAGHVLGSAQVRIEHQGQVWVVSGDYKRAADPTCAPFEVVPCDVFITEATFALPIYSWLPPEENFDAILAWWDECERAGKCAILYTYLLGKAQRVLAELAARTDRPVYVHGAIPPLNDAYLAQGVVLPECKYIGDEPKGADWAGRLVLAPPSVRRTRWVRRFGDHETAFASGWMQTRATRKRRGLSRGFAVSDHADWPALLKTVEQTGAGRVLCTHGYASTLARFLREERGLDASVLSTEWRGEDGAEQP